MQIFFKIKKDPSKLLQESQHEVLEGKMLQKTYKLGKSTKRPLS